MRRRDSPLVRFERLTTPEPNTGCLFWLGGKGSRGYGSIVISGKRLRAHQASWVLFRGELPRGLCVCHRCDTPGCVNPAHLFLGTQADNMRDCALKKRTRRDDRKGERNPSAKLTSVQVRAIRETTGLTRLELASRWGVARRTISEILNGESWTDIY